VSHVSHDEQPPAGVSSAATFAAIGLLLVAAAFVALFWSHACGYSWAENAPPSRPGRACGLGHNGGWVLLFLVPAVLGVGPGRSSRAGFVTRVTGACGALLAAKLLLAPN
jgi:hypothetical protein